MAPIDWRDVPAEYPCPHCGCIFSLHPLMVMGEPEPTRWACDNFACGKTSTRAEIEGYIDVDVKEITA